MTKVGDDSGVFMEDDTSKSHHTTIITSLARKRQSVDDFDVGKKPPLGSREFVRKSMTRAQTSLQMLLDEIEEEFLGGSEEETVERNDGLMEGAKELRKSKSMFAMDAREIPGY